MTLRAMWILAIAACSSTPPPVPPVSRPAVATDAATADPALDQDLPRLVARSLMMYQDIAAGFAASGSDCAAATAKLGELTGAYRDVVQANAKVVHDGRIEQLRVAMAPHASAFDSAAQAVMQSPTMASCVRDAGFARAFDALFEPPP